MRMCIHTFFVEWWFPAGCSHARSRAGLARGVTQQLMGARARGGRGLGSCSYDTVITQAAYPQQQKNWKMHHLIRPFYRGMMLLKFFLNRILDVFV